MHYRTLRNRIWDVMPRVLVLEKNLKINQLLAAILTTQRLDLHSYCTLFV